MLNYVYVKLCHNFAIIFHYASVGACPVAAAAIQLRHSEDASNSTSSSHQVVDCNINHAIDIMDFYLWLFH